VPVSDLASEPRQLADARDPARGAPRVEEPRSREVSAPKLEVVPGPTPDFGGVPLMPAAPVAIDTRGVLGEPDGWPSLPGALDPALPGVPTAPAAPALPGGPGIPATPAIPVTPTLPVPVPDVPVLPLEPALPPVDTSLPGLTLP